MHPFARKQTFKKCKRTAAFGRKQPFTLGQIESFE